ncbi:MAG TPA: DUF1934 domain-containing protein [Mobilitalea sp.]|nr:DUF1934 domain-containing protein [Mobilitalea sp.]
MTKEVFVTIEGLQKGTEEEAIIVTAPGIYHFTNGRHYIQYEEKLADSGEVSKNTIRIEPSQVVLSKKVMQVSQMIFDLQEITQTAYLTPYGNLMLGIKTASINLKEELERIEVSMDYALSSEEAFLSDNSIRITVIPKL